MRLAARLPRALVPQGLGWCLTSWLPLLLPHVQVGIPPAPRGVPQIEVTFDIDGGFGC